MTMELMALSGLERLMEVCRRSLMKNADDSTRRWAAKVMGR
ncbi:hypothetical protein [Archangium violaceum]|nr:hypothetical protein [Archangium violaceum]